MVLTDSSNKVSDETVLKSAGWKKDCVFRKYYKSRVERKTMVTQTYF